MPELPDVVVYVERLAARIKGRELQQVRVRSPFVVRTIDPPIRDLQGRVVRDVRRQAKRIVLAFDDELFLVIHLMIAGRLRWRDPGAKIGGRQSLAAFDFEHGTVVFTEAATTKRASLHVVRGEAALARHDRGGLEVLDADLAAFSEVVRRENHTIKRTLTDPRLLSGIGNAYSDEILHRARLSPVKLTSRFDDEEIRRLFEATKAVLTEWTHRLRDEVGDGFPEKVTAFHPDMAVHGRHGKPCPDCGTSVQRIVFAAREWNYCPRCQTGGKLLADRSLSRLLKRDWPKTIDELEGDGEGGGGSGGAGRG